jgi:hypothetical protein
MNGKITLITPPDIFENDSRSILFLHLSDEDQESVSKWLAQSDITEDINIYFYDHDKDLDWLFHAFANCDFKFIDISRSKIATGVLVGYFLGKKNTFYKIDNETQSEIFQYINQNRITNINSFLERALNGKN